MSGRSTYNDNKVYLLENSPFSEMFGIIGTTNTFKGIFDRAFIEGSQDKGNVTNRKLLARILVATVPTGLIPRVSKITREDGTEYLFGYAGIDDEGIQHLWLI